MAKQVLLIAMVFVSSCSWLDTGNYNYCRVDYECKTCEDLEVTVYCEYSRHEERKEVENPGL